MATGFLTPDARLRIVTDAGVVAPGALLNAYVAGTPSTRLDTFTDSTLLVANTNPVVASAGGLFGPIYLTPGLAYKLVLTDAAGGAIWSQDNVALPASGLTAPVGVTQGGTGLTAGVSGGVVYFSGTTAIASSALLAAHGVVLGGGAGVAPLTTSPGPAGQVLTSNGAAADPSFQTGSVGKSYPTTIASAASTAEFDAIAWTVGAAEMADGDVILIDFAIQIRNSSGGAITPTIKVKWGATSITLTTSGWSNVAATRTLLLHLRCQRVGADLWVLDTNAGTNAALVNINTDLIATGTTNTAQVMAAPTFSSSQTVKISVTLGSYNAVSNFWNTLAARVFRVAGL